MRVRAWVAAPGARGCQPTGRIRWRTRKKTPHRRRLWLKDTFVISFDLTNTKLQ